MKKFTILIIMTILYNSCAVDMGMDLVNSNGNIYDVNSVNKIRFPIFLAFGISGKDDVLKYKEDSLNTRLKYEFSMPCPELPLIKFNSFSFTTTDGEIIPSVLYYRTDSEIVFIDTLPAIFTDSINRNIEYHPFEIIAECRQSYHQTSKVYINYDIEIGGVRLDTSIYYFRKLFVDWRPRFH